MGPQPLGDHIVGIVVKQRQQRGALGGCDLVHDVKRNARQADPDPGTLQHQMLGVAVAADDAEAGGDDAFLDRAEDPPDAALRLVRADPAFVDPDPFGGGLGAGGGILGPGLPLRGLGRLARAEVVGGFAAQRRPVAGIAIAAADVGMRAGHGLRVAAAGQVVVQAEIDAIFVHRGDVVDFPGLVTAQVDVLDPGIVGHRVADGRDRVEDADEADLIVDVVRQKDARPGEGEAPRPYAIDEIARPGGPPAEAEHVEDHLAQLSGSAGLADQADRVVEGDHDTAIDPGGAGAEGIARHAVALSRGRADPLDIKRPEAPRDTATGIAFIVGGPSLYSAL